MPNATLINSVISSDPLAARPEGARRGSPAFSYDDAVSALERNSARALEIHGARPAQSTPPSREAATVNQSSARQGSSSAPNADRDLPARASEHLSVSDQPKRANAPVVTATAPLIAAVSNTAPPVATTTQATIQTTAAPNGAREAAARLRTEAEKPQIIARAPEAAIRQFAEILAKRLDGTSQFDLRLDPPALGSIDGRLTLSDDGRALLALGFDSQSTFDLFRRDEGALRLALANAGFDLAGQDLQFTFRQRQEAIAADAPTASAVIVAAADSFTRAPRHHGAIDIRA